jgi:chromosomal replication initiator protein
MDYFKEQTISQLAFEINASAKPKVFVKKDISIDDVINSVCWHFKISKEKLFSTSRKREIVQARQVAMSFSRSLTGLPFREIGQQIGNKDHATAYFAFNQVRNHYETDKHFRKHVDQIELNLKKL